MKQEITQEIKKNGHSNFRPNEEKVKDFVEKLSPYLNKLWQSRVKLGIINISIACGTILFLLFLVKPYFESNIVVLPEFGSKSTSLGGLGDLASLAGVNLANGAPTEIYENLCTSEGVLEPIIYTKYQTERFEKPVNLIEYFEIEEEDGLDKQSNERFMFLQAYEEIVESHLSTSLDRLTKILTIQVNMPESKLSAQVANEIVESLDNYIRTKRKSFATQQKAYILKRIDQVEDTLYLAENELRNFRSRNRIIEQSPALMLEQNRLLRNVEIHQAVFLELTKQLEISKIDEIKDTPVINIREEAKESVLKAGPPRVKILFIIMSLSVVVSFLYYIFVPQLKQFSQIIRQSILLCLPR